VNSFSHPSIEFVISWRSSSDVTSGAKAAGAGPSTALLLCKAFTRARSPPSAKARSGPNNTSMLSGTRSSTAAGRSGRTPESMSHNQRILELSSGPWPSARTRHASLRSISCRRTSDKSSLREGAPALRFPRSPYGAPQGGRLACVPHDGPATQARTLLAVERTQRRVARQQRRAVGP
jgi:hypothetical protein